ncbi:MAG: phosphatidylserine decarboxylase [Gammaproteobacteria bacterium]|nr:phosphatidylserine decarboxylase [Gammaproteobacteria bacterium]
MYRHQYVERETGKVRTETIYADRLVRVLYSHAREHAPVLFRALTSRRVSGLLGFLNYDLAIGARITGGTRFLRRLGVDLSECLDDPQELDTVRKIFERRIRYWECRPMPEDPRVVVSPADARLLVGSFAQASALYLKDKFFDYEELLGRDRRRWLDAFHNGDWALLRLTPDKYHYNHCPVSGQVEDHYEIPGPYHSCNPSAVVTMATPFSKNRRVITVIDTDVPGGTGVGRVAMVEVVALMIGEVVQCYSENGYAQPRGVEPGMFLLRGAPKSLYRPGSSTDVVLFQRERVRFDADLLRNRAQDQVVSRYSLGFDALLAETDVRVRSSIARPIS